MTAAISVASVARTISVENTTTEQITIKETLVSGDLHMHTVHSDGDWTVSSLMDAAVAAELDFMQSPITILIATIWRSISRKRRDGFH